MKAASRDGAGSLECESTIEAPLRGRGDSVLRPRQRWRRDRDSCVAGNRSTEGGDERNVGLEFTRLVEEKIVRVLIVDDEPLSRSSLENALRARNDIQTLDCANDAIDALELLQKKPYDVLLLDIQMPELSGIELADRLNKLRQPIPSIVFVTAHQHHSVAAF